MNNFDHIDLDKIKKIVAEYCAIEKAKDYILNEDVIFNPLVIKSKLKETKEAYDLLKKNFNISFDGIIDIRDILTKANKDIALSGDELALVLSFCNHTLRIKNKLNTIIEDINIKGYGDSLFVDENLINRIDRVVDVNGNIKEDASPKLKEIFKSINKNADTLKNASATFISRHGASLQESNVFTRNDRVAFLLKNSDKNKFKGYQYGSSASGLATYVEPEEFIELNNRRLSLENDKQEEVNRILKEVSYYVGRVANQYILNFDSLIKLDVLFAKAEYGFYKGGCVANICDNHDLYLKEIAHPLIDEKSVVLNTYSLKTPYKGIVISGTNTGGKTVGLKLIGLSVLMSYLGIPILASEANIPFYENVYIDIDDNQSITNALSTFSAHICNINEILNRANHNSLILIDELISGTDPKEAQAISLSILKEILKLNAYFVITTHYDDIKEFAYNNDSILLSSVGFDLDKLKPTYKYLENSVGVSNAIDIASRYFDNQDLIEDARNYLVSNKSKQEELLDRLSKEIADNEKLKNELNKLVADNEALNNELTLKIDVFEMEKADLKSKYNKELNDFIEKIKEEAYEKLDSINEKTEKKTIIKQIEQLKVDAPIVKEETFEIGDSVRIGESNGVGEIVTIDGNKVSVNVKGMIIKTKLDNLTKLPKKKTKKEYRPRQRMERVSREINLVGQRVEEALSILDPYLDSAFGSGLTEVKIIHGAGTGQLRNGIREHLKKNKIVKEYNNGDVYDGGGNVTIVKFKSKS